MHPRLHTWFEKRYDIGQGQQKKFTSLPHADFDITVSWILETLDDLDGRYEWGGILNTDAEKN